MPILNGEELLKRARRLSDDRVEPYYIDDVEMYTYLSEAERALAVQGKWLRDTVTYELTAEETQWVALGTSPEVLEFRTAKLIDGASSYRYDLRLQGTMDFSATYAARSDYGLFSLTERPVPARPKALIFGRRSGYFEVSPIPDKDYTIEAALVYYPLYPLESDSDEPSIPERFHAFIPVGAALFAVQSAENEHTQGKIQGLEAAWQRALMKASAESGAIHRDASSVRFSNDFWD